MQDRDLVAAILSHEMRQPLQAIRSFLSIVLAERAGSLNARQRDFLETANGAAERLELLVNDVEQLFSASDDLSLDLQPIALRAHLRNCAAELAPIAHRRCIAIDFQIIGDPDPMIAADPRRLDQLLSNLIGNAISYAPRGSTVQLRTRANQKRVLCLVANEILEPGTPSTLDQWFDPWFRSADTKDLSAGRGLGLAVVNQIIEAHGWTRIGRLNNHQVSLGIVATRYLEI